MLRATPLVNHAVYHVFNKSIAGYRIFNSNAEYQRMLGCIKHYQSRERTQSYSKVLKTARIIALPSQPAPLPSRSEPLATIIAFCLMPTHFHLALKQTCTDGISIFLANLQNSYTRYFNLRHSRRGPLWVGPFRNVLVERDEQLLHLTRYIHLNPCSSQLVEHPREWPYSSYKEYLGETSPQDRLCEFQALLPSLGPPYAQFVEDRQSHQRELHKIKSLLLD